MDKLKSLLTKKLTPEQQKKEDAEFAEFLKLKKAYDEYNKLAWESASISGKYPRGKFIHYKPDRDKVEALTKRLTQLKKENPSIPDDSADWTKIEKRWKGRKYGGSRKHKRSRITSSNRLKNYLRTLSVTKVRSRKKTPRRYSKRSFSKKRRSTRKKTKRSYVKKRKISRKSKTRH